MNKTMKIVTWVAAAVLSAGSAILGVSYLMQGRVKHGLLFLPVIPVLLIVLAIALVRQKPKPKDSLPKAG